VNFKKAFDNQTRQSLSKILKVSHVTTARREQLAGHILRPPDSVPRNARKGNALDLFSNRKRKGFRSKTRRQTFQNDF